MNTVIYGAQGIALSTYKAIKELNPDLEIKCFLVTARGNNAMSLGDIPVYEVSEFVANKTQSEKDNIKVLIGTPENVMDEIEKALDESGLYNHERIDSVRWNEIQGLAFSKTERFKPLATYLVGYNEPKLEVYKMVHHKDKELKTAYVNPEYMSSIQVGAAKTDVKVADLTDNIGENISDKNGNFSELTGLYWIWKNILKDSQSKKNEYIGLVHYRRVFALDENDLLRFVDNDIDVVLPYPMPYEPDIEAHHERYLSDCEWKAVLQALEELQPEYAQAFKNILKQDYLYNYNIIIAKRSVLFDYCSWLFPLLFRIEKINDPNEEKAPNRYIGYIGETLETLYFMCNRNNLKIAHAGYKFLT